MIYRIPMVIFDWDPFWKNLLEFGTFDQSHISLVEKVVRPVVVYLFLVFVLRRMGKRILAQLNPFDLVVLLTLSNTVQNAIIGEDNSITGGIIGAATLLVVNHCVVRFLYSHKRLECLIEGAPTVLIEHAQKNGGQGAVHAVRRQRGL